MRYQISYEMALELLYRYLERFYVMNKHKGASVVKAQKLFQMSQDYQSLVSQLKTDGHDVDTLIREIKQKLERIYVYEKIQVYVDGAARNNDDPAKENSSGIAFAIYGDSQTLHEQAVYLGAETTLPKLRNEPLDAPQLTTPVSNNVAEYMALIASLEHMLEHGLTAKHVEIFSDSNLIVNQVNMTHATRSTHLIQLRNFAQELIDEFDNLTITYIPREQNTYVDGMLNNLLDQVEEGYGT